MEHLDIGTAHVPPGARHRCEIPFARLPTGTELPTPLHVVHGVAEGPRVWLSAAIHGDELNGVEIIRQVMDLIDPKTLIGSVVAVPIVNVFGFVNESRYLPDRRDLNRGFPGSDSGSLAARLAHRFMQEIVLKSTHGIDLHTGSDHRTNIPQIRASLDDPATFECARAFGAPVLVDAHTRDGSLREAAAKKGIPCLLYEAGEAHRFDKDAIEIGVRGVLRVLNCLGMRPFENGHVEEAVVVTSSKWVRARRAGLLRLDVEPGDWVEPKQKIGTISNSLGQSEADVRCTVAGIIIGQTRNPVVHKGDGIVHVGQVLPSPQTS